MVLRQIAAAAVLAALVLAVTYLLIERTGFGLAETTPARLPEPPHEWIRGLYDDLR